MESCHVTVRWHTGHLRPSRRRSTPLASPSATGDAKSKNTYEMREEQWFCRALLGVVGMCSRWYLFHIIPILICWGCCSPGLCTTEGTVETHIVWFIVVTSDVNLLVHGNYLQHWQDMTRSTYVLVRPANENPWKSSFKQLVDWLIGFILGVDIAKLHFLYRSNLFSCWKWFFFVAIFDFSRLPPGARCPRLSSNLATFPSS